MTYTDDMKVFLFKFHNDDTKKGTLTMILKQLIMVPKQFKKFCNDDTKKFKKVL